MKIFISHSGDRSQALAQKLHWFIGALIQATDPWISTGMDKGVPWAPEVAENLEKSEVGIICLTRENLTEPWILFEAGALSKKLGSSRVCTFLLDMKPGEVNPPLGHFQATKAEQEDVFKLIETINGCVAAANEKAVNPEDLRENFEHRWPKLDEAIANLRTKTPPTAPARRQTADMLEEVLNLTRAISRRLDRQSDRHSRTVLEVDTEQPALPADRALHRALQDTLGSDLIRGFQELEAQLSEISRPFRNLKLPAVAMSKKVDNDRHGKEHKGRKASGRSKGNDA